MQGLTAAPRDSLTAAQVTALIGADALEVSAGCELLDADEVLLEDISDDFEGGVVERNNYRTIHGTCRLEIARELMWGSQRVRPYMTLNDGTVSARFNLGIFLLDTPVTVAGDDPVTWSVEGYDKLVILDTPIGSTYRVASGAGILATVRDLIEATGETAIQIEQEGDDVVLPADRQWPIAEENTYLHVCNDLLASAGFRALWVDHDGFYRSEPYRAPSERPAEWAYDTTADDRIVGEVREFEADYFGAPNEWTFIRDDPAQDLPEVGDGLYVVTNTSDGPTSIDARGRTIRRVVRLQAADHASLVAQADRMVEADKQVIKRLRITTGPNPLHGHFDVVEMTDPDLGIAGRYLSQSWSLPLDNGDMQHEFKAVS